MPVADSIKAIGHGIGWLIPGVQEAQAMEASANAHRQKTLNDAINRAIQYETANPRSAEDDPDYKNRLSRLFDMQGKVQQMGPFDNPKSIGGQFWHDYISLHPDALMPGQSQQPKVVSQPGPKAPGGTPGTPNLSLQVPPVGGGPSGGGTSGSSLNATLPGTSPVSPQAQAAATTATQPQGGGSSPNATFPSSQSTGITGIGDTGAGEDSDTVFKTESTALGPPPDLTLPPRPSGIRMPVSLSGDVSTPLANAAIDSQQPYIQAQAAVEQALNEARGKTEFQMAEAPRKLGMIKQLMGEEQWNAMDKLPGLKTELISAVLGVQIPGVGAMFTPHLLTPDALGEDLMLQYPELRGQLEPKGRYELRWSPGQGYIASPRGKELKTATTADGKVGVIDMNKPEAGVKGIEGTVGKADFSVYLPVWLKQHQLPLTPYTMRQALAEWTAAGQKPPQNMVLVPNDKDGTWTSQLVRPGTKVDPRFVTVTGGSSMNVPTAAVRTQGQLATALLPEGDRIKKMTQDMESAIGPAMGRGYKFAVNKIGVDYPQFAGLDTELDAFSTAFMKAHGLRGKDYHDTIVKQLTEAQSPADLRARIDSMENFLRGYQGAATAGRPTKPGAIQPIGGAFNKDEARKKYGY